MSTSRTTILRLSKAPKMPRRSNESQKTWESPKPIMTRPKPATAVRKTRPTCRKPGRCARNNAIPRAPTAGAACRHPSPVGPTRSISRANTGSNVSTPPNRTANRSKESAAKRTGVRRTKRMPSRSAGNMVSPVSPSCSAGRRCGETCIQPITIIHVAPARALST